MSTIFKTMICALGCVAIAAAAPLTITFVSPALAGPPGVTLDFRGTLLNTTGATVFLNSANENDTLSATADLTPFLLGPISLNASQSSGVIDLFTLAIPKNAATGSYTGSFTALGGATAGSQDILGTANFRVTVNAPGPAVPEPASIALVGASILLIGGIYWRRREPIS